VIAAIESRFGPIRVPKIRARRAATEPGAAPPRARSAHRADHRVPRVHRTAHESASCSPPSPRTRLYVLAPRAARPPTPGRFLAGLPDPRARRGPGRRRVRTWTSGCRAPSTARLSRDLTWNPPPRRHLLHGHRRRQPRAGSNVVGHAATVIDLARDAGPARAASSTGRPPMISGDRKGHVLRGGPRGRSAVPQRLRAHQVRGRAAGPRGDAPAADHRGAAGDSSSATGRTGEIDKLDGPVLPDGGDSRPTPSGGAGCRCSAAATPRSTWCRFDYVVEGRVARSRAARPRRARRFHLVDPAPLSGGARVFEAVARARPHREAARPHPAAAGARGCCAHRGLSRLGRGPLAFVDVLDHAVHLRPDQHRAGAGWHRRALPGARRVPAGPGSLRARRPPARCRPSPHRRSQRPARPGCSGPSAATGDLGVEQVENGGRFVAVRCEVQLAAVLAQHRIDLAERRGVDRGDLGRRAEAAGGARARSRRTGPRSRCWETS